MNETLLNWAQSVHKICEDAGRDILEVYNRTGNIEVETKSDESPVTAADLAAHQTIISGLSELTPDIPILSEESALPDYSIRKQWSQYWLIDPLDGTKEFINRNGEFTVNIALIRDGDPILGIVYVPVKKIAYIGVQELGAWKICNNERSDIRIRTVQSQIEHHLPIELVASRRHGAEAVENMIQTLETEFGQVSTKSMGSSLKLCLIAEGEADLYPRLALTSEWDTAAAHAVVNAAGGKVIDANFDILRYNQKDNILNPYFFVIGDTTCPWEKILSPWKGISPDQ
ncbi:3'(2'),5'-bisphosphate nucleotidase CysQ [Sessilibacter sp. MAH1]